MIGIYKITNPKGAVYIGQSKNIDNRWKDYFKLRCKKQQRIFNSLNKYGVDNHTFEVIEECDKIELLMCEKEWINYYIEEGKEMLNIVGVDGARKKKMSEHEFWEYLINLRLRTNTLENMLVSMGRFKINTHALINKELKAYI